MERQNCRSAARSKSIREFFHECFQNLIFVVYIDPQCLEGTGAGFFDGFFFLVFRKKIQCFSDQITQCKRSVNFLSFPKCPRNSLGNFFCIRFIGVFNEHAFQFIACNRAQTLGCGNSCLRIQAKIQRSIIFVGKAALRIINLHGGNTKIRQNEVKGAVFGSNLINIGKILMKNR